MAFTSEEKPKLHAQTCTVKTLLYGDDSDLPKSPPHGKGKGRAGNQFRSTVAPFAQSVELPSETYNDANFQLKKKSNDVQTVKVGLAKDFDAAVYAASRTANLDSRSVNRTKNERGAGNILSHDP